MPIHSTAVNSQPQKTNPTPIQTIPVGSPKLAPSASHNVLSLIAGPFTKHVTSIWRGDRIHQYLGSTDRRRHLWHAWLSNKATLQPTYKPNEAYSYLSFERSQAIAIDGLGSAPRGYIPALGRLGAQARKPKVYSALHRLLSDGGKVAKIIHHLDVLDDETILALASVPQDQLSRQVIGRLIDRSVDPSKFPSMIWMMNRLKTQSDGDEVDQTISQSANPILEVQKQISNLAFPPPPFSGMGLLSPVTSAEQLGAIAQEHKNCLTDFEYFWDAIVGVHSGRRYFFQWCGEQPALILFSRFAGLGWVIREAFSIDSAPLTFETQEEIGSLIFSNQAICPVWPDRALVPTLGYYFDDV